MKRGWGLIAATAIGALIIGGVLGASAGKTKNVAGPTVTVSTATTETATQNVTIQPTKVIATHTVQVRVTYTPPPVNPLSDGVWVVGQQVIPGIYSTDGKGGSVECYAARLSSFKTSNIIDNVAVTGPTTIQVDPTDKALELSGGCTWSKTG